MQSGCWARSSRSGWPQASLAWDDRTPVLLQPCGAVPKGTAHFQNLCKTLTPEFCFVLTNYMVWKGS